MSLSRPLYDTLYRSIVKTFTEAGGYGLLDSFGSNNASAAYSLRSLRDGYIGPVVRVRRSGDNAERDFSHGQIDNGVLTNWVNQLSAFDPEVATDLTDQALAAHSLRDLTGLSRPVVRLRRASDNAESDFTAADLVGSVEGSELVTNGGFDTDSDWTKGTGWSITGGQAVCDGTQVSNSDFSQAGVADGSGQLLLVSFDIVATSNLNGLQVRVGDGASVRTMNTLGFGVGDTVKVLSPNVNGTCFLRCTAGVTATIDNFSVKPYTPSAAEAWAYTNDEAGNGFMSYVSSDSAYVTTWYDQSASNEQVFDDPTIQSPGDWTAFGTSSISQGLISIGPANSGFTVTYESENIQPGTYRIEVDYYGVTQGNRIHVEGLLLPAGSGTLSGTVTISSAKKLTVGGSGAWSGQVGYITGIRLIDLGNLATQTTLNNQPKLIKAGVTNTVDNKPAILFNDDESSVRTWLDLSYFPAGGSLDSYYVVKPDDSIYLFPNGTSYYGPVYENTGASFSYNYNNANFKFYVNGRDIATSNRRQYYQAIFPNQHHLAVHQDHRGDGTATNFGIYNTGPVSVYNFNGSAQEILVYDTSQLANRTKIERNINRYYNLWYEENTKLIGDTTSPTAAAAYSLRSLDGDATANVVKLRRASDNEERDFTAADLVGSVEGAELVDNSNWMTTGSSTHWTINGSLLSIDGTQTSQAVIRQDGIIEAKQYVLSFDVTCNNYNDLWIQYLGSTASRFYTHELGITTDGSYSLLLDLRGRDNPLFRFYVKQSGTQATLDNVSLKEYTPSVAEEWSWAPTWRSYTRQAYDTAFVTTLYDQAASNEQVFDDPTMQSTNWAFTRPDGSAGGGSLTMTKVDPGTANISGTCNIANYGGSFRVEIDYTTTGDAEGDWAFYIQDYTNEVEFPVGTGTLSVDLYQAPTAGKFIVRSYNQAPAGATITITGIRLIDLGNPAAQSTATAQPKLITAGVTEKDNGKPAMVFDGTDDFIQNTSPSHTVASIAAVWNKGSGNNKTMFDGSTGASPINRLWRDFPGSGTRLRNGASTLQATNSSGTDTQNLTFATNDGVGGGSIADNGETPITGTMATNAMSAYRLGGGLGGYGFHLSYIQEVIVYDSDQSANRTIIETNINNHYNIY